jgi:hypothetical protein
MAAREAPAIGKAFWTRYSDLDGESRPTDPLRFNMYAVRLGNVLLPGITNRVGRLRYFGMVCAGLERTRPADAWNEREHARMARRRFLPFERSWVLANVIAADGRIKDRPPVVEATRLKPEFEGLRGANNALNYFRRTRSESRVHPSAYTLLKAQESQGGLGSYLTALRAYGFVERDRLVLTGSGEELARRFRGPERRHCNALLSDRGVQRGRLGSAGEALGLPHPGGAEARLVSRALFEGEHPLAELVALLPASLRQPHRAREAFEHLAQAPWESAPVARYVMAFEPFRIAGLELFGALGRALTSWTGPARILQLPSLEDIDRAAVACHDAAARLVEEDPPPGLQAVHALAERLTGCASVESRIDALVAFHRQEGRAWIVAQGGGRYELGRAGAFDAPGSGFHGYTLPSALHIYQDALEVMA